MFISKRQLESLEECIQDLNERATVSEAYIKDIRKDMGNPEDGKRKWFGYDFSWVTLGGMSAEDKSIPPKKLSMWETINQVIEKAGLRVKEVSAIAEVVKVEEPKAPVKRKRKAKKGKK